MSESEVIARTGPNPITRERIAADLKALGIKPGMTVLVHSSLNSLGWVCGGAPAVILALEDVLRPYGTLVMPAHSGELSDPAARGIGKIPEVFRSQSGVLRSSHPQMSFCAWGEGAVEILSDHSLANSLSEKSPLGKLYEKDGWVLFLGTGFESNTSFHLAEYRAEYPVKKIIPIAAPLMIDGHRRWKTYNDLDLDTDDFEKIGKDFLHHHGKDIQKGKVGNADCLLFRQRQCVDFAVEWMHRWRRKGSEER
jgi:aminoglycoside 3-N-acetyltransferase